MILQKLNCYASPDLSSGLQLVSMKFEATHQKKVPVIGKYFRFVSNIVSYCTKMQQRQLTSSVSLKIIKFRKKHVTCESSCPKAFFQENLFILVVDFNCHYPATLLRNELLYRYFLNFLTTSTKNRFCITTLFASFCFQQQMNCHNIFALFQRNF